MKGLLSPTWGPQNGTLYYSLTGYHRRRRPYWTIDLTRATASRAGSGSVLLDVFAGERNINVAAAPSLVIVATITERTPTTTTKRTTTLKRLNDGALLWSENNYRKRQRKIMIRNDDCGESRPSVQEWK